MSTDFETILDEIEKTLTQTFSNTSIKSYEPAENLGDIAPAALYEVQEIFETSKNHDGRTVLNCRFALHGILPWVTRKREIKLIQFAGNLAQLVSDHGIWIKGGDVKEPTNITAVPGSFDRSTNNGFDSWVVFWEQKIVLGLDRTTPEEVRDGVRLAINPLDEDNPDEYKPIEHYET